MAERYIPEHRRTQYKARNQFKPDELRRRREEQQVEIRKQKRDENLAKRRGIQTRDGGIGVGGGVAAGESDDEASAIESEVCATAVVSLALPRFFWVSTCVLLLLPLFPTVVGGFVFFYPFFLPDPPPSNELFTALLLSHDAQESSIPFYPAYVLNYENL